MDLVSQLRARKKNLKSTKTQLTNELGERYEITNGVSRKLTVKCVPFVVDEKPDMQIASIIDGLFMSSQDPVACDKTLKRHRISHVLSLGIRPTIQYDDIVYHFVNFLDLPDYDIFESLKICFRIVHRCKSDNILVHCNAGVSRSATVIVGYLMASEGSTYDEALERVKAVRSCVRPNDGFARQLRKSSNLTDLLIQSCATDVTNGKLNVFS